MSECDELYINELVQSQSMHFINLSSEESFLARKQEECIKLSAYSFKSLNAKKIACPSGLESLRSDLIEWRENEAK